MVLHLVAQYWKDTIVISAEWQIYNFFYSSTKWAVPIFVMISGALFLKRSISIRIIFKKYIFRIITAYIFWSALYSSLGLYINGTFSFKEAILHFFNGHYHLWFLYMIIGLYLVIPLCKSIIADFKLIKYFLILSFLFAFLIPFFIEVGRYAFESVSYLLENSINLLFLKMPLGFVGYFILGYYLNYIEISKKKEIVIYLFGVLGGIVAVVGTSIVAKNTNKPLEILIQNFSPNILMLSVALFVFAKQHLNRLSVDRKIKAIIAKLSKYSFGVYLSHALVLNIILRVFDYQVLFNNLILSTLFISIIVFIVSYIISFVFSHIPVINKYIV